MKDLAATVAKAAAALTDAYASGWASDWVDAGEGYEGRLLLDVVKGTATTIELKLEVGDASSTYSGTTAGYPTWSVNGSGAAALDEVQITCADLAATDKLALAFTVAADRKFRLLAKRTGGSASTTLAASVVMGRYS